MQLPPETEDGALELLTTATLDELGATLDGVDEAPPEVQAPRSSQWLY